MNKLCALVKDGLVQNVIVCANINNANEKLGGTWVAVPDGRCGIGWTYENGEFIPPQIEEESDESE